MIERRKNRLWQKPTRPVRSAVLCALQTPCEDDSVVVPLFDWESGRRCLRTRFESRHIASSAAFRLESHLSERSVSAFALMIHPDICTSSRHLQRSPSSLGSRCTNTGRFKDGMELSVLHSHDCHIEQPSLVLYRPWPHDTSSAYLHHICAIGVGPAFKHKSFH